MVATGEVDASAIDSQVLAVELRDHPELADAVQVIETLGPSTIQPLVAAKGLPAALKSELREVVTAMHRDGVARTMPANGFVERFVPVADADYDDIRRMLAACEDRGFLSLH